MSLFELTVFHAKKISFIIIFVTVSGQYTRWWQTRLSQIKLILWFLNEKKVFIHFSFCHSLFIPTATSIVTLIHLGHFPDLKLQTNFYVRKLVKLTRALRSNFTSEALDPVPSKVFTRFPIFAVKFESFVTNALT